MQVDLGPGLIGVSGRQGTPAAAVPVHVDKAGYDDAVAQTQIARLPARSGDPAPTAVTRPPSIWIQPGCNGRSCAITVAAVSSMSSHLPRLSLTDERSCGSMGFGDLLRLASAAVPPELSSVLAARPGAEVVRPVRRLV